MGGATQGWIRGEKDHLSHWLPHCDTPMTEVWETLIQLQLVLQTGQQMSAREGRQCGQAQPSIFGRVKVRIKRVWSPAQYNSHHIAHADATFGFQTFGAIQPSLRARLCLPSLPQEADIAANYQALRLPIWSWVQACWSILKTHSESGVKDPLPPHSHPRLPTNYPQAGFSHRYVCLE